MIGVGVLRWILFVEYRVLLSMKNISLLLLTFLLIVLFIYKNRKLWKTRKEFTEN